MPNLRALTLLFLQLMVTSLAQTTVAYSGQQADCGLACSYIAIGTYVRNLPPYSKFRDKYLPYPNSLGVSAAQIVDICEDHELYAAVVDIVGIDELSTLLENYTAIVLLDNQHFVLAQDVRLKHIELLDVPSPEMWTKDDFSQAWDGIATLVSNKPIILPGSRVTNIVKLFIVFLALVALGTVGFRRFRAKRFAILAILVLTIGCGKQQPRLEAMNSTEKFDFTTVQAVCFAQSEFGPLLDSSKLVDLGRLTESSAEHTFPFYVCNNSDVAIRLSEVRLSCACTKIDTFLDVIQPGDFSLCNVTVQSGPGGNRAASLTFIFDQPFLFDKSLSMRWDTCALAEFVDSEIQLGSFGDEEIVRYAIPLRFFDSSPTARTKIRCRVDGNPAGVMVSVSGDAEVANVEVLPDFTKNHFRLILETNNGELLDLVSLQMQRERQRHFPVQQLISLSLVSGQNKLFHIPCSVEMLEEARQGKITIEGEIDGEFALEPSGSELALTYLPPSVPRVTSVVDRIQLYSPTVGKVDFEIVFRIRPAAE